MTTVVFGLLRMICVVIPIGHIRWHARSIAAFGAILAGWPIWDCRAIRLQPTCLCHDCLFLWRCDPVTARLNAAILGACGAYYFGAAARGALFPGFKCRSRRPLHWSVCLISSRDGDGYIGFGLNYITGLCVIGRCGIGNCAHRRDSF